MWKRWLWKQNKEVLFIIIFSSIVGFIINTKLSSTMQMRFNQSILLFPLKYLFFIGIGIVIFFFISLLSWPRLRKIIPPLFFIFLILTFLTLIIGKKTNHVRRWILIGPFSLQSSEFVKVLILYINGHFLALDEHKLCMIFIGISAVSFLLQPDLGMTILLLSTSAVQIIMAKKNLKVYGKLMLGMLVGVLLAGIFLASYFKRRLLIFFGKEAGFQITRGLKLIKQSSFFGSASRDVYIPDSHCDFVFTEICGFFGIIIALVVIFLPLLLYRSIRPHLHEKTLPNDAKQLFLLGLGAQYFIQTYIHIFSNLAIIPTKGMNLPIISFGGSNVIAQFMLFGFICVLTKKHDRTLHSHSLLLNNKSTETLEKIDNS